MTRRMPPRRLATPRSVAMLGVAAVAALTVTGTALAGGGGGGGQPAAAGVTIPAPTATAPSAIPPTGPSTGPSSSPTPPGLPSASSPQLGDDAGQDVITAERARKIALERTGGGEVTEVERELEHGRPVWDVELVRDGVEYEVDVDRETGEVLRFEADGRDGDDDRGRDDHGGDRDGRGGG